MQNYGLPGIAVFKNLEYARPTTMMDIYGRLVNEMQGEAPKIMDDLATLINIDLFDVSSVLRFCGGGFFINFTITESNRIYQSNIYHTV